MNLIELIKEYVFKTLYKIGMEIGQISAKYGSAAFVGGLSRTFNEALVFEVNKFLESDNFSNIINSVITAAVKDLKGEISSESSSLIYDQTKELVWEKETINEIALEEISSFIQHPANLSTDVSSMSQSQIDSVLQGIENSYNNLNVDLGYKFFVPTSSSSELERSVVTGAHFSEITIVVFRDSSLQERIGIISIALDENASVANVSTSVDALD